MYSNFLLSCTSDTDRGQEGADANPKKQGFGESNEHPVQEKVSLEATEEGKLQMINLSTYTLSADDKSVLQKRLTFSPTCQLDKFMVIKDLYLFCSN